MKQQNKIDVKLNYNSKGEWWMAKGLDHAKGPGDYPKLKVDKDKEGEITFKIQNPNDVTFAATGAFAPKKDQPNPADFGDQFTIVSGGGTKTLVVKDANANKNGGAYPGGDYNYELRFSNGTTLDPIITNGGCCQSKQSTMAYYAIGAVALVALIVLIVRPMMKRR